MYSVFSHKSSIVKGEDKLNIKVLNRLYNQFLHILVVYLAKGSQIINRIENKFNMAFDYKTDVGHNPLALTQIFAYNFEMQWLHLWGALSSDTRFQHFLTWYKAEKTLGKLYTKTWFEHWVSN